MFFEEIYSQPHVMNQTADNVIAGFNDIQFLKDLFGKHQLRRIVFTGMGSSCSVVYPSILRLIEAGWDARVVEASELIHYQTGLITSDTLLVVISQSGRSAEILPILNYAKSNHVSVLGITNTANSPLHLDSQAVLFLQAGEEATVATKTYTCTFVGLHLLVSFLLSEDVEQARSDIQRLTIAIEDALPSWHSQMKTLAQQWQYSGFIEYVGRGYSMASATTSALISKESIKMPTEGMNSAQFRHGPLELVNEAFTGMIFMGDSITWKHNFSLATDIVNHRGNLALISQTNPQLAGTTWVAMPHAAPTLLPLVEIVPIQLFCGEMAMLRGFEAGAFRYITKVTVVE